MLNIMALAIVAAVGYLFYVIGDFCGGHPFWGLGVYAFIMLLGYKDYTNGSYINWNSSNTMTTFKDGKIEHWRK